ncbi:hypothetical protein ASPCADRAFT_3381 [Aspergillus carbonarius ITEM 5010]|uniref:Uncharacterized protein n=1 Tax=Aspergillus carbonarius (strain ITEM 5010) TaxID=602072 RepID=A0A1R3RV23_ASPC5|nr:hypothetical protein ASPCADRAFT_3381 [Aspergillus carbonarius ITEM 5010]
MGTEPHETTRKRQRQEAAREGHETRRRKQEAKVTKMHNAREYKENHASTQSTDNSEPEEESSDTIPNDPIRAWFEDRMTEIRSLDLHFEIEDQDITKEEEKYKTYLEYYLLARMLADDVAQCALNMRMNLLACAEARNNILKNTEFWDVEVITNQKEEDYMEGTVTVPHQHKAYLRDQKDLKKIWGREQGLALWGYSRWRLVAYLALAKSEPNWCSAADRLNRAAFERMVRQGQDQFSSPGVQGSDILKAMDIQSPDPLSKQELKEINAKRDEDGLITPRKKGYVPLRCRLNNIGV